MKFVEITLHWHCTSVCFSIQPTHAPASDGQSWQVSASSGLNWFKPSWQKQVFARHDTTTAALR